VHAVGIFESVFADHQDLKLRIDSKGGTETGKTSADDENVRKKCG